MSAALATSDMPAAPSYIPPDDVHNRLLTSHAHPAGWVHPTPQGRYNLVVIGSGAAGLTAAAGCATVGGRVALIERHMTGGDCLIAGCVPSKGMISAGRVAALIRDAAEYGVRIPAGSTVDFPAVMARMRRLRARISPADSVQHLTDAGVDVFLGQGRFAGPDTVEVDSQVLRFSRAVIATGGRADVPAIPGLQDVGYLTNETVFELTELPRRLAIIGGGPIGCEMAQAFRRLGSDVTLIHNAGHILNREDADAADMVQRAFLREGITLWLGAKTLRAQRQGDAKALLIEQAGKPVTIACDAILVSAGRTPNTDGLGLEAAGVRYDQTGVLVDERLRTSNPRVYAAGDICSRFKFTHTANVLGRMAMINALLWGRHRASSMIVPWCTYTDPEIAHVGLYESQAKEQGHTVTTLTVPLGENDRAILDGQDEGFARVHLKQGTDQMLGATIVAAHAGDLITYVTLAMNLGKGLSALAGPIYPYPTQAEVLKKVANQYLQTKLTPQVKRLTTWLLRLRR